MAGSIGGSLDRALEGAFTRPAPKSAQAWRHGTAAPADRGRRPRSDVLPRQQHPRARPGVEFTDIEQIGIEL